MPILLIFLFYINDLMKIKRFYSQTEFVGQQIANILQNIAKTRTVTANDIRRAASLAYLTIYPGTTMYTTRSGYQHHTFNHQPRIYVYYVRGEPGGKASTKWALWTRSNTSTVPLGWSRGTFSSTAQSSVSMQNNAIPSSIYPTLKIEEGKAKILIDIQLRWGSGNQYDANGKVAGSAREVFGFHFVNPKYVGTNKSGYFSSVIIFSPNHGFSETVPS